MSGTVVQEDTNSEAYPLRKRIGRLVFFLGLLLVASGTTLSLTIGIVGASSGSQVLISTYSPYLSVVTIVGVLMAIIGLIAWILPYGIEGDGLWIFKTGPFIK